MGNALQVQIESPQTIDKFKKIFMGVHRVNEQDAQQMFEVERFSFLKEVSEKGLTDVTPISAMGVFLDITSMGLSFNTTAKHVYLMGRNVKNAAGQYEKRLVFSTSPDGKIYQCQRSGAIDYVTKPVIVYEGDDFALATNEKGEQIIRHQVKIPRTSQKIIAGYVYVIYKGGIREPYWMDINDIERLKGYSAKNNSRGGQPGNANALYSSNNGQIDTGFFGAKLISHALKNIRKSTIASQHEIGGEDAEVIAAGAQIEEQIEPAAAMPEQIQKSSLPGVETVSIPNNEHIEVTYGPTPIPDIKEQSSISNPNAPF